VSTRLVIVVWRIAPLWLIWTIWREWSARCFEDHEKLKDGLKNILVQSLFNWTRAVNISYFSNFSYLSIFFFFSNFSQFVGFCSSFRLLWGLLLYTSCVLELHSSTLFNEMNYLLIFFIFFLMHTLIKLTRCVIHFSNSPFTRS